MHKRQTLSVIVTMWAVADGAWHLTWRRKFIQLREVLFTLLLLSRSFRTWVCIPLSLHTGRDVVRLWLLGHRVLSGWCSLLGIFAAHRETRIFHFVEDLKAIFVEVDVAYWTTLCCFPSDPTLAFFNYSCGLTLFTTLLTAKYTSTLGRIAIFFWLFSLQKLRDMEPLRTTSR